MSARDVALPLLAIVACGRPADPPPPANVPPASSRPALVAREPAGADVVAAIDAAAGPCVDFYRYPCGGWLPAATVPPTRARYIRGFDELADRNNAVVRRLFERAAADPVTPIDHKVGAFWSASARSHECPHPARTDS